MKKLTNTCIIATAIFFLQFIGCKSSSEGENELDSGKIEVDKPSEKIAGDTTLNNSPSDYAIIKSKTLELVKSNETEIAAFKTKLKTETEANKIKFQREIDSLMAKNKVLKSTLENYKEQGANKLNLFKERLQKSIDDINKDIETYKTEHK